MVYLPFILFVVAFAAAVVFAVANGRANARARARALAEMGFVQAPPDTEYLAAEVARHEHNSEYSYRVVEPMRASIDGRPVWFYVKERVRQGWGQSAYELRFRLRRPSAAGLVLAYKPTELASRTTLTSQGSVARDGFDSQPDDLTQLEIPVDLRQGNLINVLGPANASLYDLIDPRALAVLEPVCDFGIELVIFRGDWCSFANSSTRMVDFDMVRLWPIVLQLVTS